MNSETAVMALAALAQHSRLAIYRLLVQAGPEGLFAGQIGAALGIPVGLHKLNATSDHITGDMIALQAT